MSDTANKIGSSHLQRAAFVYIRQSSASQVEHNRESTQRQYALAQRATGLGWSQQQINVVDDDLGLSGASTARRGGFARMTAEVALGHVGIILGLEVFRLARNNADWYRLLDLCTMTDTLIGDADGVYNPALFNDRLLLGLKGTRPNCTFCARVWTAAFATRLLEVSCAGVCRPDWCGARPTAKSGCIPMKPS
ncbi:Site-specific recombinase, DNA invertase Pin-like protein [Pseudomonas putida TRO1]|jgi:hypothetical protein|uniref:Site-specific recombinase, DNA invertase Pin-like protein n=1 Tax=Pseudomonas putida TRO1 TaxID=1227924 RepID=A0AAD2ZTB0_PSEPU|nr:MULTISPECIES: recombinase family protein [Pseudomonas]ENY77357.1 Site-specific recombinase, DNA invertase Pin-like protein [Pseudomonas putida TRO1]MDY7555137.1 recombinase family protein [Pseudomonas sp. FG1]MEB0054859.1 recombinase family protein [Pseudomonas sp. FG1]